MSKYVVIFFWSIIQDSPAQTFSRVDDHWWRDELRGAHSTEYGDVGLVLR